MSSVWTVILAAGRGSRFGSEKALARWGEISLLRHACRTARAFSGARVLVVLAGEALSSEVEGCAFAVNPDSLKGMGSSLACGVRAVLERDPGAERIAILLVDQPRVTVEHLHALNAEASGVSAMTEAEGRFGPPALLIKAHFEYAMSLADDRGLKSVLKREQYSYVSNSAAFADADTPEELERLHKIPSTLCKQS